MILLQTDKDSKTQLQQLGTHQIRMGSTYIKFSTIIHLDQYHRDNVVYNVIDARTKVERMSNKRKLVEYDRNKNETRKEPLSKIFKPDDGTGEGGNKDTTSPEEIPSAGPSTKSAAETTVPKLEPKEEPKELETEKDMKTELGESNAFEELSDALKPGIKSEKMMNEEKNESEDEFFVAKAEVIPTAEDTAKKDIYQADTEKEKAWEKLTKLLAEWKAEDMLGYTGSIEVQRKLIKSVSNDRCNQIERKTFVNDIDKILPFRARLKVGLIYYLM